MRGPLRDLGISGKLFAIALAAGVLGLGTCAFIITQSDRRSYEAELAETTKTLPAIVQASTEPALVDRLEARRLLQATAEELGTMVGVRWIEVFDEDARVIAHTDRNRRGNPPMAHHAKMVQQLLKGGVALEELDVERGRLNRFDPILNSSDAVIGVVETIVDLDEQQFPKNDAEEVAMRVLE